MSNGSSNVAVEDAKDALVECRGFGVLAQRCKMLGNTHHRLYPAPLETRFFALFALHIVQRKCIRRHMGENGGEPLVALHTCVCPF